MAYKGLNKIILLLHHYVCKTIHIHVVTLTHIILGCLAKIPTLGQLLRTNINYKYNRDNRIIN